MLPCGRKGYLNMSKRLSEILKDIPHSLIQGSEDTEITGICMDSRKVASGNLFICISGYQSDGHDYIPKALEAGAGALIVEKDVDVPENITVIRVENARPALALISSAWYDHPSEKLTIIGLTGTKGKTTTAHMIKRILEEAGHKVGMIGTNGAFIGENKVDLDIRNTTPESFDLQYLFSVMLNDGCSHVVMEVSSQSLKLHRVDGIDFDTVAFLNLSPDHISPNEHADFDEYKNCKLSLFEKGKKSVIFMDNEHSADFLEKAPNPVTVSFGEAADFRATDIHNLWEGDRFGVEFNLTTKDFTESVYVSMPGSFNAENALIACAVTSLENAGVDAMKRALSDISVKGRTQVIKEALPKACVMIDYAHNAFSTQCVLEMLKEYHPKRLVCVFGCGGNRAASRRIGMGEVAGAFADLCVITMDNPRYEEMADINKGIIEGIEKSNGKYIAIDDRAEAINWCLDNAEPGDIFALLGKGHETYQEVKGVRSHFSEEEVVKEYFR